MTIGSTLAPWRFASRLARREVRRRPGRTVLVALLVALPVAGMTVASVLARTEHQMTWLEQRYGEGTDLVVTSPLDGELALDTILPPGSSARNMLSASVGMETSDGTVVAWLELFDVGRLAEGSGLTTTDGRQPHDGEVWLTSALAQELDVDVGEALTLAHPSGTWTVVGLGESPAGDDARVMVMPDIPVSQFRDGVVQRLTTVNLPADVTGPQQDIVGQAIRDANGPTGAEFEEFGIWADWDSDEPADDVAPLAWTWVIGTIALAATGIIVAAAFATSARRQLATIGILSANGSSERLTRRVLAAQGAWTGAAGSIVGVGLGLTALGLGRSALERINGGELGDYQLGAPYLAGIAVTGVAAATIAALVPARSASRVPVMAALAGRRPLGKVPPRLVPRGLALAALGALLLVLGALSRDGGALPTIAAILGALFVLAGMCCCSPLAVDWMGRVCSRLQGTWRLAGRGLGRTRTRSAAVVTAIAVIGALTTAGSAVVAASNRGDTEARQLPVDSVLLVPERREPVPLGAMLDLESERPQPVPESIVSHVEASVPGAQWHPRRVATWDPAPVSQTEGDPYSTGVWWQFVVADEATMDLYELPDADREALADTGVLLMSPWFEQAFPSGTLGSTLRVPAEAGVITLDVTPREEVRRAREDSDYVFRGIYGNADFLITEEAARAAGFDIIDSGGFVRSDEALTSSQREAIQNAVYGDSPWLGDYYVDIPRTDSAEAPLWSMVVDWPGDPTPETAIQAMLAAVAFVLTLLVVAIGLALAASEGAAERDVLVAIGGRPATMRSMAAAQAVVLTMTGVLLAVPFGLLPTFAVMRASGTTIEVPWPAIGFLVVAVPPLAGGVAWLVSAIAQRVRPVRISNLAFD